MLRCRSRFSVSGSVDRSAVGRTFRGYLCRSQPTEMVLESARRGQYPSSMLLSGILLRYAPRQRMGSQQLQLYPWLCETSKTSLFSFLYCWVSCRFAHISTSSQHHQKASRRGRVDFCFTAIQWLPPSIGVFLNTRNSSRSSTGRAAASLLSSVRGEKLEHIRGSGDDSTNNWRTQSWR